MHTRYTILLAALIISFTGKTHAQGTISTDRNAPAGMVTFGSSITSGVLGTGKFIDGYVKKQGDNAFIFPVGDNGNFRPFSAAASDISGAYYGVDAGVAVTSNPEGGNYAVLPAGGPFKTSSLGSGLSGVSKKEYWDINGSGTTRITLTWNAASDVQNLTAGRGIAKLTIAGWNGSQWIIIPSTYDVTSVLGGNTTASAGSITTNASLTPDSYNVYTLAAVSDGPLPVTLVSFTAAVQEQSAYLQWVTATEFNSDYYDVERSQDGKVWNALGKVDARGSGKGQLRYDYTDHAPASGANLYRLKMVDQDGTFAYSRIISVDFGLGELAIFPNPVSDVLFVKGVNASDLRQLTLTDLNGRTVYTSKQLPASGLDIRHVAKGLYFVNVVLNDGTAKSFKVLVR
ncbi:T9SS type A sorting domain-containing protein [Dyadobacter sandarakinus]|uniref:T9SS type A sorting domain-containing protein n=1 Tax=Dyadobacter sandarakinus TaxID=2747268 RepID=A0ABX7I5V7_9BACT|nr:T9SS type A sorting domain-containing protein [Dyadobacter sandarakinus]QRR00922.1 T9SS type A sorting domain-containing protein [Dyadobacter sandarakinus]